MHPGLTYLPYELVTTIEGIHDRTKSTTDHMPSAQRVFYRPHKSIYISDPSEVVVALFILEPKLIRQPLKRCRLFLCCRVGAAVPWIHYSQ